MFATVNKSKTDTYEKKRSTACRPIRTNSRRMQYKISKDIRVFESQIKSENVQVLDVRTKEEYEEGHLAGAKQIDIKKDNFLETAETVLDKSKTIAVYCRSGKRSAEAAKRLSGDGYKVINMKGGILKWKNENKPVVK